MRKLIFLIPVLALFSCGEEKPVEEVIRIPNGIPAIISTETFQKVQVIIAKRKLGEESPRRSIAV